MVPSLTETLLQSDMESHIEVVGRTRFCIHPKDRVASIPIVGGTKDIDWEKVKSLKADLLILDQEENPKKMADDSSIPFVATHFDEIKNASSQMKILAKALNSPALQKQADRYQRQYDRLKNLKISSEALLKNSTWCLKTLKDAKSAPWIYLIWKKPWMSVEANTFIGSQLSLFGFAMRLIDSSQKYPEVSVDAIEQSNLLFSSEPYPFHKEDLSGFSGAVVNGESLSWFGIRNLEFLESIDARP